MLDNNFKVNDSYIPEGTILNPYKPKAPLVPDTDNDAFYATVLSQSEDPVDMYQAIEMERKSNEGYSDIVINVRDFYRKQKDSQTALLIEEIIADQSIDLESKKQILESYTLGTDSFNLKDEYLNFLTNSRLANLPSITDDDIQVLDLKINKLKAEQALESVVDAIKTEKVSNKLPEISPTTAKQINYFVKNLQNINKVPIREAANAWQLIFNLLPLFLEVAGTAAYQGASALGKKADLDFLKRVYPTVDWETARQKVGTLLKTEEYAQYLNEIATEYFPNYQPEDVEKGAVATFGKVMQSIFHGIGKATTPDDPTKGQTIAELIAFMFPYYKSAVKKGYQYAGEKVTKTIKETVKEAEVRSAKATAEEQRFQRAKTVREEADLEIPYKPTANRYNPYKPKKNSPFVEAAETNPRFTHDLANILMEDVSGKVWEALKITPEQFLMNYYGPRIFDVEQARASLYDATDAINLKLTNDRLNFYRQQNNIDSVFLDVPERLQYSTYTIQDIGGILHDPSIRMINSDLVVRGDGVNLYTSTSFRKANGEFYTNPREALIYARIIENTLAKAKEGRELTTLDDLTIESYDLEGNIISDLSRSIDNFAKDIEINPEATGLYNIKWQRKGDFTEAIRDRSTGFGNTSYLEWKGLASLTRPLYTSSKDLYNMFFNYGALSKEFQTTKDIAGLKGLNILDRELKELTELSTRLRGDFNRDLRHILERKARYYHYNVVKPNFTMYSKLTKKDLVNILGYTPRPALLNDLFYANNLLEDINYFKWQNNNVYEINRMLKAGYNNHVTIPDPTTGTPINYMVKSPEESLRLDPTSFTQVLDLATKTPVDFSPSLYRFDNGKHYIVDPAGVPYKQILRLGTQYSDNKFIEVLDPVLQKTKEVPVTAKYDYIAIGLDTKLGNVPSYIIPFRPHYMPNIVDGTVFLRRYPKYSKLNGVVRDLSREADDVIVKEHKNFRETVGAFNDMRSAELYKDKEVFNMETMVEKDAFIYKVEKGDEFSFSDLNEFTKLQEAALKTSSRRGDHLWTALYKDPLESMIETSRLVGTRSFYQQVLEQQKVGWVQKWKNDPRVSIENNPELLTRSQKAASRFAERDPIDLEIAEHDAFPLTKEQINPTTNSKENRLAAVQAIREWEALTQLVNGFPDEAMAKIMVNIAQLLENIGQSTKVTPLEKAGNALQKRPGMIGDTARNFVTTSLVIYSAFWKHWIQQPIMGLGYLTVAGGFKPSTISLRLYNAMSTLAYATIDSSLINKATKVVGIDTAKYRDPYRQKAYEAMVSNWSKDPVFKNTKGFKRTFEQSAYLYESLYNRGVFNLAEHTLAKGLFNNKTATLDAGALSRGLTGVSDFFSKASVQTGEHIHRVIAAEAAIEIWEAENPGKSWHKNEKAMDTIAQYTRQMTQSMDRMASNTFQRVGVMKYISQLQTFMVRLAEQLLIPDATPLTRKQNLHLLAFNTASFGVSGLGMYGIPAGIILYLVSELVGEDAADMLDKGIIYDMALISMLDSIFPTYKTDPKTGEFVLDEDGNKQQIYTTTRPSKYLNPLGDSDDVGLFYTDFIKLIAAFGGVGDPNDINNVALQHLKKSYANVDLLISSLGLEKKTDDQIMAGLEVFAKFTGLGKTMLNLFLYDTLNHTRHTLQGQATGAAVSNVDRILTGLLNSQPEEVTSQFKTLRRFRGNKQLIKELADETFDALRLGMGTQKMTAMEIKEAVGAVAWHLKNTHNLKPSDMDIFWSQIDTRNNQLSRSIKSNIMQELVDLLQVEKDNMNPDDQAAIELILRRIQENPNAHPDYEYVLQSIKNRSKGDIGATEKIYKFKEKLKEKIAPAIEVKPGD